MSIHMYITLAQSAEVLYMYSACLYRERGREGKREGGREGGRERGREGGREGGREEVRGESTERRERVKEVD